MDVKRIQLALIKHGFNPGNPDGIMGPDTEDAIIEFKQSQGLRARAYIGKITLRRLFGHSDKIVPNDVQLPWLNAINQWMGVHESSRELEKYLASDGRSVGDPDDIPWCAELLQTVIALEMPKEKFIGKVKKNPFLAVNWLDFGVECELAYGAIAVFWRGSAKSWKGHLAVIIGYDPKLQRYRIRGGNQSDRVCDTWISAKRLRKGGLRVPKTFIGVLPPVPIMNSNGAVISTNEA